MWRYIRFRLLSLIPVIFGVSFVIFSLLYLTPGDPARMILGDMATEDRVAELRQEMGLNDPFFVRYGRYVWNALHGDIGRSYVTRHPVNKEILSAFPATLKLASLAIILAVMVGIPLGIISAVKQYSLFDNIAMIFALVGVSMPVFWLGLLLILFFSVHLGWLPSSGFSTWEASILPAVTLSTPSIAVISRITRSGMLEVIRQDYIRTIRAKGQLEFNIIWKHALRNALIPVVTVIGLQFGALLEGSVLTESVFSVPGVGRLMVEAIKTRDYPLVQGGVLYMAIVFSLMNLAVDLIYAYIDPRIKAQYSKQ